MEAPKATSTPTVMPRIQARKGIREAELSIPSSIGSSNYSDGLQISSNSNHNSPNVSPSPIRRKTRSGKQYKYVENVDSNEEDEESSNESDYVRDDSPDRRYIDKLVKLPNKRITYENYDQRSSNGHGVKFYFFVLSIVCYAIINNDTIFSKPQYPINEMCQHMLGQNQDFCINIEVNIREVNTMEQPRTILFLYEEKTHNTMDEILNTITAYASCHLNKCLNHPIEINGESLNSSTYSNDYGKIISKYTDELRNNIIMIVNNFDKMPGVTAQAFHSFCDEYNPSVKRALFLFTIQVPKLPKENPIRYIEEYLSTLWNDIGKDDKFDPLFARISSTVLMVKPEIEH